VTRIVTITCSEENKFQGSVQVPILKEKKTLV